MTPQIQCSNCGKRHYVHLFLNRNGVTNVAHHWKHRGSAIYCPKCSPKVDGICEDYESNLIAILDWINKRYELVPRETEGTT